MDVTSPEIIAIIASAGTVLGYILKGLFDSAMGRDQQTATTSSKKAKTEAQMTEHYRNMALKADEARHEMQKELIQVRREMGKIVERNAQMEEKVQYLERKVERLCKSKNIN